MKAIEELTLDIQKKPLISTIERIILYEQYYGKIKSIDSPVFVDAGGGNIVERSEVVVDGDARSVFVAGNYCNFPLFKFELEYYIYSRNYDSTNGETTIQISLLDDGTPEINTYIAKKIDITKKLTLSAIGEIKSAIEGRYLGEFDSGYMRFQVSNHDGYFQTRTGTGLFDKGNQVWVKYIIKLKGSNDSINYFGGLIDLTNIEPDIYNKTLLLKAFGHSYELGRYPAYDVYNENEGYFPRIGGVIVIGFTSSNESEEGIKQVSFTPFKDAKLNGITLDNVSVNTRPGIKLFEFHYPNKFRWDNGTWLTLSENPRPNSSPGSPAVPPEYDESPEVGMIRLYDKDNDQYCTLIVGDDENLFEFPDHDTELWVDVKDEADSKFNRIIENQGEPYLTFDNGLPAKIRTYFQTLMGHSSTTGLYSDVTQVCNDPTESVGFLIYNDNEFIFSSPNRFWGIYFDMTLYHPTGIGFSIHYSIGGELFSSDFSSLVEDGTDGFTKSGYIKWNNLTTWAINNITPSSYTQYKGFMVKIIKTSGSDDVIAAKRFLVMNRAQGENGDFLEFKVERDGLSRNNVTDSIIIKNTINGWTWGMWPNNITANTLMSRLLDRSYFHNDKRDITDITINTDEKTFNIWGTPPRPIYNKKPTAMYIDWSSQKVYIGLETEIWYSTFTGSWTKLFDLSTSNLINTDVNKDTIINITLYGNDLYLLITDEDYKDGLTTKVFTYNLTTKIITKINELENVYTGKWQTRGGHLFRTSGAAGENYFRIIGGNVDLGDGAGFGDHRSGESLCFAYRHKIYCDVLDKLIAIYPANGIEGIGGGFPEWYFQPLFGSQLGGQKNGGAFYYTEMGFFQAINNSFSNFDWPGLLNITFEYGSEGNIKIYSDFGVNIISFHKKTYNGETFYVLTDLISGSQYTPSIMRNLSGDVPIAQLSAIGYTMWAFTQFKELDGLNTNYSFISKASISFNDWKKVAMLDPSGALLKDFTNDVNAGIGANNIFPTNDIMLVLGHDRKIKSFTLELDQSGTNDYEIYYSTAGDTWTLDNDIIKPKDDLHFTRTTYCIVMPDNWVKHSEYGYSICIKITSGGSVVNIVSAIPTEQIVWDSSNESSEEQRIEVVNMGFDSTNNVIFGCAFNRNDLGSYPFQWCLFSFDISTETMTFIRTANNYIFDGSYVYKNFTYDSDNDIMYAYAENIRYKDGAGFLISIKWNSGSPIVNRIGYPDQSDWGSINNMLYYNNKLFGLTNGDNNILWEFSNSYSPRIELVEYGDDDSFSDIFTDLAMLANFYYMITSERLIKFKQRESVSSSIELIWDSNMVASQPQFPYWNNYYDAIIVGWSNLINKTKGNRKKGFDGWLKNSFSMNNPLIQNTHIANIIADIYYNFFSNYRLQPERIKTSLLHHIEVMDGMTIKIPNKIADIDIAINYVITEIVLSPTKQMTIKGLERKI